MIDRPHTWTPLSRGWSFHSLFEPYWSACDYWCGYGACPAAISPAARACPAAHSPNADCPRLWIVGLPRGGGNCGGRGGENGDGDSADGDSGGGGDCPDHPAVAGPRFSSVCTCLTLLESVTESLLESATESLLSSISGISDCFFQTLAKLATVLFYMRQLQAC